MKFLRYVARPTGRSPDFAKCEGAYVNCWVSTRSLAEAKRIARKSIRDAGWLIEELEAATEVERSDFKGKALAAYDVAAEKKWAIRMHMWRRGASQGKARRSGAPKGRNRVAAGG